MQDVRSSDAVEVLEHFHLRLDSHFQQLYAGRCRAGSGATPVFALEHDLEEADLQLLQSVVRTAVAQGFGTRFKAWWLPFVVYAAESGYGYIGDEYWQSFEASTPWWRIYGDRNRIRRWFEMFANDYGGAVPKGAFAAHFPIIAWPITHAVLPKYLQRNLAQLLFEFSSALTSDLLHDPADLGTRLALQVGSYTERFRVFCENTTLLGQVSAALLSGDDEPTPYLLTSTLNRIIDGLSEEQQAHHWLKWARRSASRVRGFQPHGSANLVTQSKSRVQRRAYDPRLFLKFDAVWTAHAELPDLTPLGAGLPEVYNQLRTSRSTVNGAARHVPPSGLLYAGQEVQLTKWPQPDQPFIKLERGDEQTNSIIAAQSIITHGPWWLFRRNGLSRAFEVKGKYVRLGRQYVLIGEDTASPPSVRWCTDAAVEVAGVKGYELTIPALITEDEESALRASGLAVDSHVAIHPVGVVPSAWDGEGELEMLSGEPVTLGVCSDLQPQRCRITINGATYFLEWSQGERELLFALEGLAIGTHELNLNLLGDGDRQLAAGSIVVTIHDPQIRPENATIGEGIRMLPAPARPTLSELWDEKAGVTIDGPNGADADLQVTLYDSVGNDVADLRRTIRLPLDEGLWKSILRSVREDHRFKQHYDMAESCVVRVSRQGVGFASLTFERGFRPLHWRVARAQDGGVVASLVDRTDGASTTVELFHVEAPLTAIRKIAGQPFNPPARGGLAIARAGDATAALILPTEPNAVLHLPPLHPVISTGTRSSKEVLRLAQAHNQWLSADLPADPFAAYEQQVVGETITQAIGIMIGGRHWEQIERQLPRVSETVDLLESMKSAIGVTKAHRAIASAISSSLYIWSTPNKQLHGFTEVMKEPLRASGISQDTSAPRFLLTLAERPGHILDWKPDEVAFLIDGVLQSPVLYRAARYAVLGTQAFNDVNRAERRTQ